MLGRFLELSVATPDVRASMHFYGKLGFSAAEVGEAWSHPYAVVTDGRLCLGLHQSPEFAGSLTFVKPDLFNYVSDLEGLGFEYETRRLGNDVFNEVTWLDPAGHRIRLVEARTFSPTMGSGGRGSMCGYFREIAMGIADPQAAKQYWERLGFVGLDAPDDPLPHVECTSDTINIGLYGREPIPVLTLRFDLADFDAGVARLAVLGVETGARVPPPLRDHSVMLVAPEGTHLLLTADEVG